MSEPPTIITLGSGSVVHCPLPYEEVRRAIQIADCQRSHVVELPIDWAKGSKGADARDSLLGLDWIKSVRSWPA